MNNNLTAAGSFDRNCRHPVEHRYLAQIDANVNCETTVIRCGLCRENLTEPKTDCR